MIEHVMAAVAGLQIDNCLVQIDAGECPGCDGSSRPFVEALDAAGTIEQSCPRKALIVDRPLCVQEGDAMLAVYPDRSGRLTLTYHLDYGKGAIIPSQSCCIGLSPESLRNEVAPSRTFLLELEAAALRAAGIGMRTTHADLLIFGKSGVIGNQLRFPDEWRGTRFSTWLAIWLFSGSTSKHSSSPIVRAITPMRCSSENSSITPREERAIAATRSGCARMAPSMSRRS